MLELLDTVGPLLVTSANAHGRETPANASEVLDQLVESPDLVLDDGPRPVVPSTLVNCNLPQPAIERHGVIADEDIEKVLA
jgi:tRNA A37 threonylcarbamoyladenosine synthetase subunit TsaC/SUA5/YrdC